MDKILLFSIIFIGVVFSILFLNFYKELTSTQKALYALIVLTGHGKTKEESDESDKD